ncbi:group I truncated hemoglobin [Ferrimonas futtsuensis]|uniref:group I truncated hemoglobin n=1 Tax=Ferrimonas futtsuensis TaxID=364764 RepID=UPI000408DB62|nr:group 1 truncated hemoglobin [Ferrimonas futtsuensis]
MVDTLHQLKLLARVLVTMLLLSLCSLAARAEPPSLYDRLGGLAPISVVVSDFIDALVPDAVLNSNPAIDAARTAVPPAYLKYHVTAMMCQVTGGPCQYHGRDMRQAHAHLNIQEVEWQRMMEVFKEILAKHQVPQQEVNELLAIMDSTKSDIVVASP